MDVLCYIWDQCFIGLDIPDYHCLPYLITVWLLLLRNRLITCQTVSITAQIHLTSQNAYVYTRRM